MKMKLSKKTMVIGMALLGIAWSAPSATAAKFQIDGGFVTLGSDKVIKLSQESGRYPDLGRNYYRTTTIGCKAIRNVSKKGTSGQLSLEYWASPLYGSEMGTPLMSLLLPSIKSGKRQSNVSKEAPARYYNDEGYVQLRLYEYTAGQWVLRVKKNLGDLETL